MYRADSVNHKSMPSALKDMNHQFNMIAAQMGGGSTNRWGCVLPKMMPNALK